jgi:hypothetical protein
MMNVGSILKCAVSENLQTYLEFALRCLVHNGTYRFEALWNVQKNAQGGLFASKGSLPSRFNTCIAMGGEIPNSFMCLYELSYFFECAALAAVATTIKKANCEAETQSNRIGLAKEALLDASADDWESALSNPTTAVISTLDADIIPVRYGKHQLWRIPDELLGVRCQKILTKDLDGNFDRSLAENYWCDDDEEIADTAIAKSCDLSRAKAVQLFLALTPFAKDLNIDLCSYPLYFSYWPKEELVELGEEHSYFEFLSELHRPHQRLKFKRITGRTDPWCISIACPVCGQASKRVIQSKLSPDGKMGEIRCKSKNHIYQNEYGTPFIQRGCGSRTRFELGATPQSIYSFIKNNDITMYYPVKQILRLMRTSNYSPIAWPLTDLGVNKSDGKVVRDVNVPRGFGENLDMLTTGLAIQQAFLDGLLCQDTSDLCRDQRETVEYPVMLLAHLGRGPLFDDQVRVRGTGRSVTDTSSLKAKNRGEATVEMFRKAINFATFDLDTLLGLRTIRLNSWRSVVDAVSQIPSC